MSELDAVKAAGAGDLVIPAGTLDHAKYEALKLALSGVGLDFIIVAGVAVDINPTPEADLSWIENEVDSWRQRYASTVDPSYLEDVVQVTASGEEVNHGQMLTRETIVRAFESMYGHNRSTAISSGKFYRRMVNSIVRLRGERQYLEDGAVFVGERRRPGYIHPDQCWAITPAALYGLTIEPEEHTLMQRQTAMGQTSKARGSHLLSTISDSPQATSIHDSGWIGHQRGQSVG